MVVLLGIARPLLFASLDEPAAAAAGVPVRFLGMVFLGIVGITAGEATQAIGSLLLLGLLAGPAAAAQSLTTRPWAALLLSAALSVACMWSGLAVSYAAPSVPPSFAIISFATGLFLVTGALSRLLSRRAQTPRRPDRGAPTTGRPTPRGSLRQSA